MKQKELFGNNDQSNDSGYVTKVTTPAYEPRGINPHPLTLVDSHKYERLKKEIAESSLDAQVKKFLYMAATRHLVFNYERIADFYSTADKETQDLMEKSALVIIDFNKAIQLGYVKLSMQMANKYIEEYDEE